MLGTALPAWAADAMTLTFVRHGESEANAAGVIDTSVPGPHLTDLGRQQADAVADELAGNNYDGVYASSMIRTQETAEPLATRLHQDVVVLPGLREIDAGVFEGQSEDSGLGRIGYVLAPVAWTLGARFVPVLGSTDGNAFDARVDDAVQTIYDSGDRNAVVFARRNHHVLDDDDVDNPDLGLILSHPLDNTSVVVSRATPKTAGRSRTGTVWKSPLTRRCRRSCLTSATSSLRPKPPPIEFDRRSSRRWSDDVPRFGRGAIR